MMLNLTQDVLNRPLTVRQWEAVDQIETLVSPRFSDKLRESLQARTEAESAYIRTVAEVNADPRYRALLAIDTKSLTEAESATHQSELKAFEQRIREANKARVDAGNRDDNLMIEQETAYAGACLVVGEITGFRMGLRVFASMLTCPDKWGVTADRPAAALMVDLLTNDALCLETIHKLMGDLVYNAATGAEVPAAEIGAQNPTLGSDTV